MTETQLKKMASTKNVVPIKEKIQGHSILVSAQCQYVNSGGEQCKKVTVITHPYCPAHTEDVFHLRVGESSITGAGLGLFALRDFKRGDFVIPYEGEKLSETEHRKRYDHLGFGPYVITLSERYSLDAKRTSAGLGRYVCDYHGSERKPNVKYYTTGRSIEIRAIKNISAGEELLVDYGKNMRREMLK